MHGKYRVAFNSSTFAMPETAIGFFCDVCYFSCSCSSCSCSSSSFSSSSFSSSSFSSFFKYYPFLILLISTFELGIFFFFLFFYPRLVGHISSLASLTTSESISVFLEVFLPPPLCLSFLLFSPLPPPLSFLSHLFFLPSFSFF